MIDAIMRTYQGEELEPAGVLNYLNRHVFTRRTRLRLITAVALTYNPSTRSIGVCSAGHPPPLWKRADGTIQDLPQYPDIPLRVNREHDFVATQTVLEPGDIIVVFTDGIVEARSPRGEMFRREGLLAAVACGSTAAGVRDAVRDAVREHCGSEPADDDRTLVALQIVA